jgi:dTDP-4-amino-4,6-dideoxygalactose transaminase
MEWRVSLSDLDFGIEEEQAVIDVLHSRWLTMGSRTNEFEKEFSTFTGATHAIAVSNATQALHLACVALGIGPGTEVIVPSLTFVATSNAVLYTGAEVRFAEIMGETDLTISPGSIERLINERTKAIMVMHYGGYACDMQAVMEIARKHNLAVIEDAAHAPGAWLDGKHLGTYGDIGCFSFFSNKNLAVGEGGMMITNNDDLDAKLRLLRSHGMTTLTWDRHKGHAHTYDVVELGYNDRIDEIRSALGLIQLAKLTKNNQKRSEITETYRKALADLPITLPFSGHRGKSSCHIFPILLPDGVNRSAFIDNMQAEGIQTSIHYPPIHTFTYYRHRYAGVELPLTEQIAAREVTLPLYPTMTPEMVEWVVQAVKKSL